MSSVATDLSRGSFASFKSRVIRRSARSYVQHDRAEEVPDVAPAFGSGAFRKLHVVRQERRQAQRL